MLGRELEEVGFALVSEVGQSQPIVLHPVRDPLQENRIDAGRGGQQLDVSAAMFMLVRPPEIDSGGGAGPARAVGRDQRAVQDDVGVPGDLGGQERPGPSGPAGGQDGDRLVEVVVGGTPADGVVAGQLVIRVSSRNQRRTRIAWARVLKALVPVRAPRRIRSASSRSVRNAAVRSCTGRTASYSWRRGTSGKMIFSRIYPGARGYRLGRSHSVVLGCAEWLSASQFSACTTRSGPVRPGDGSGAGGCCPVASSEHGEAFVGKWMPWYLGDLRVVRSLLLLG